MLKNLFKKKEVVLPEFFHLKAYANKDKYFIRLKPWDWVNSKEIYVATILNDKPTMVTMDFWPQEIYLDADGQIAVSELVDLAAKQYADGKMDIPNNLDVVLIEEIEKLVRELAIIEFRDEKTILPSDVAIPMSKQ